MDYEKNTIAELKAICTTNKIKGISKKTKKEIIEMIMKNETPITTDLLQQSSEDSCEMQTAEECEGVEADTDSYTPEILKQQYALHKAYVFGRIEIIKGGVKVRLPCIPEDISENIVKQIIRNRLNDKTSSWECKNGDLYSKKEGKQECKCFTSDGPLSFTPSSEWDVIYFLDARQWLTDNFALYRIPLKRTSVEWKNLKMNKTQTFEDQTKQGRRPRINWELLFPQVEAYCSKVFEGTFDDIFIPVEEEV